jgi:hypothetical protein
LLCVSPQSDGYCGEKLVTAADDDTDVVPHAKQTRFFFFLARTKRTRILFSPRYKFQPINDAAAAGQQQQHV